MKALTPRRRAFVWHYVAGEDDVRGIAYKSYLAAGFKAKSDAVASSASYQLLQDPKVKLAIEELLGAIEQEGRRRLKSWMDLAVKAQNLLERYLDTLNGQIPLIAEDGTVAIQGGILLSTNALSAINAVLDRALGKPTQPITKDVGERLDTLIRDLAANGERLPPLGVAEVVDEKVVAIDHRLRAANE